ncbi:MAG: SOS response-associated peptidase family protein [Aestuariivirga sp.]
MPTPKQGLYSAISAQGCTNTKNLQTALYAFLTTEPNQEVGAIHPKAMPVILTKPEEWETWLNAEWAMAGKLQRSLPDGALIVVARGGKSDALNNA